MHGIAAPERIRTQPAPVSPWPDSRGIDVSTLLDEGKPAADRWEANSKVAPPEQEDEALDLDDWEQLGPLNHGLTLFTDP